jgi:hypothetical protein
MTIAEWIQKKVNLLPEPIQLEVLDFVCIRRMKRLMRERGIRMRKPGVWEVPVDAVSP